MKIFKALLVVGLPILLVDRAQMQMLSEVLSFWVLVESLSSSPASPVFLARSKFLQTFSAHWEFSEYPLVFPC